MKLPKWAERTQIENMVLSQQTRETVNEIAQWKVYTKVSVNAQYKCFVPVQFTANAKCLSTMQITINEIS